MLAQHCPLLTGVTAPAARVGYQVLLVLGWWVCFTAPFSRLGIFKLIQKVSFFSAYVSVRRCQATESLQRCHDWEVSLFVLPSEPSYLFRYHFYAEIPMDVGIPDVPGCTNYISAICCKHCPCCWQSPVQCSLSKRLWCIAVCCVINLEMSGLAVKGPQLSGAMLQPLSTIWWSHSKLFTHSTGTNSQCFWSKFCLLLIICSRITGKSIQSVLFKSLCIYRLQYKVLQICLLL
jgi:hypothetical protein